MYGGRQLYVLPNGTLSQTQSKFMPVPPAKPAAPRALDAVIRKLKILGNNPK